MQNADQEMRPLLLEYKNREDRILGILYQRLDNNSIDMQSEYGKRIWKTVILLM